MSIFWIFVGFAELLEHPDIHILEYYFFLSVELFINSNVLSFRVYLVNVIWQEDADLNIQNNFRS